MILFCWQIENYWSLSGRNVLKFGEIYRNHPSIANLILTKSNFINKKKLFFFSTPRFVADFRFPHYFDEILFRWIIFFFALQTWHPKPNIAFIYALLFMYLVKDNTSSWQSKLSKEWLILADISNVIWLKMSIAISAPPFFLHRKFIFHFELLSKFILHEKQKFIRCIILTSAEKKTEKHEKSLETRGLLNEISKRMLLYI